MVENHIILFDGLCNLCNESIRFIIRHDKLKKFKFSSLQSEQGEKLLNQFNLNDADLGTIVYICNGKPLLKSTAWLQILSELGTFPTLQLLGYLPACVRDLFYDLVAV